MTARQGRYAVAIPLFEKLVDEGETVANCYLGMIYEYGNSGRNARFDYARFYYQHAAEQGWVAGYIGLGRLYYYGLGVDQNLQRAFECFSKIHDAGIVSPIADYYLGQMYSLGEYVEQDQEKATFFLRRSSNHGYLWATARLARIARESRQYTQWIKLRFILLIAAICCLVSKTDNSWRTGLPTSTMGPSTITAR